MKPDVDPNKIVILSGAGLSAESGLPTFRDSSGLWNQYSWMQLASTHGWQQHPEAVLAFYNERRKKAWDAEPNAAHRAIASLQSHFNVVVITQNVDELHERAGSSHVIHLHGELAYARTTAPSARRYRIEDAPIAWGQRCEEGAQLRPDIVWFGEDVRHIPEARQHMATAAKVLVVGTSLTVEPAASLLHQARGRAEKVIVALEIAKRPYGFNVLRGKATNLVPHLASRWLDEAARSASKT